MTTHAAHPVPAGPAYTHPDVITDPPDPGPTGPEAATWAAGLLQDAGEHVHLVGSGTPTCLGFNDPTPECPKRVSYCELTGVPQ